MPHQCVKCSKIYENVAQELLKGCTCGGKFFFFVKDVNIDKIKKLSSTIKKEDKDKIEKDVFELIGDQYKDKPVILELESIRILKHGQYEISLVDLFSGKPLVFKVGDGKYYIDLAQTFNIDNK
ncbi:hypothetical protein CL617_03080 [archaeon]|nr:hypothetical protein [archaeon]